MDDVITIDYGSGGKKTSELIEKLILPALENEALSALSDGAVIKGNEKLVFSTDSFVVNPVFFPGGDIGKLSVCGTVNDISVSGGVPKYLSLGLIIEEGFAVNDLKKIINSIKETADKCGVQVVTGDTKVVEKGKCDGIYINTAGIGFAKSKGLSSDNINEGDCVIVSGTVGDHGVSVMLARGQMLLDGDVVSDCAPVLQLANALMGLKDGLKIMRDPTRGGLATTLCEFVEKSGLCIELEEKSIPVRNDVNTACDLLGLDPLYCACEGRIAAVVAPEYAEEAINILKKIPGGENAAIIGRVVNPDAGRQNSAAYAQGSENTKYAGTEYDLSTGLKQDAKDSSRDGTNKTTVAGHGGVVLVRTPIGGTRILTKLSGAQLPRIC